MTTGTLIDAQLSTHKDKQQANARHCLLKIFSSLKFIGQQGLALRGHTEESGNLMQLLHLRAEDDDILREWMLRSRKWTSHDILNEMVQVMAHDILRQIAEKARKSFYALIVDGTTDKATKEQVSICFRTVDDQFYVEEDFVGFYETASTTAEVLVNVIKDVLLRCDLKLSHCRR